MGHYDFSLHAKHKQQSLSKSNMYICRYQLCTDRQTQDKQQDGWKCHTIICTNGSISIKQVIRFHRDALTRDWLLWQLAILKGIKGKKLSLT
jgi:hypothetical protein